MAEPVRHDLPFLVSGGDPRCVRGLFALLASYPVIGFGPEKVV